MSNLHFNKEEFYLPSQRIKWRDKVKPSKKNFARQMRCNQTEAESLLWEKLRRKQTGFKFRRQVVLRGWIVDFYCPEVKLAIEADGGIHQLQKAHDGNRDAALGKLGVRTLRFSNQSIFDSIEEVLSKITKTCEERNLIYGS